MGQCRVAIRLSHRLAVESQVQEGPLEQRKMLSLRSWCGTLGVHAACTCIACEWLVYGHQLDLDAPFIHLSGTLKCGANRLYVMHRCMRLVWHAHVRLSP
jgi:hypothetical protein